MARETPPFEEFVAARAPALLRTAFLLTGDWRLATDLVHMTLLRCCRRWRRIAEPEAYALELLARTYVGGAADAGHDIPGEGTAQPACPSRSSGSGHCTAPSRCSATTRTCPGPW